MTEPTEAQLAEILRQRADFCESEHGWRSGDTYEMRLAAQRLESRSEISEEMVERAARAIGRTGNELGKGCDEPCDTDGGTCICIELNREQARAALAAAMGGKTT
jgi:hypothetical protein